MANAPEQWPCDHPLDHRCINPVDVSTLDLWNEPAVSIVFRSLSRVVIHRLNNRLSGARGFVSLITQNGEFDGQTREDLAETARLLDDVAYLGRRLIALSRFDVEPQVFSPNDVINEAVVLFRQVHRDRHEITTSLFSGIPAVLDVLPLFTLAFTAFLVNSGERLADKARWSVSTRLAGVGDLPAEAGFSGEGEFLECVVRVVLTDGGPADLTEAVRPYPCLDPSKIGLGAELHLIQGLLERSGGLVFVPGKAEAPGEIRFYCPAYVDE
jgi:hypothetical protein